MRKPRQMNLIPEQRKVAYGADPAVMRIFVRTCIGYYRDAVARHLPPDVIRARKATLAKVWRALDDARVRVK